MGSGWTRGRSKPFGTGSKGTSTIHWLWKFLPEVHSELQSPLSPPQLHAPSEAREVDAPTTGVWAVLSQYHGEHPCGYFSRKLSPAERNYDIGNWELLAIKLALEEWRHWQKGAQHPFKVITAQKKLEYLQSAKRLNPRQALWALFFTRFQFSIMYRPGDKNVKADSLSHIHASDEPSSPEPILPPAVLVSPIWWALDEQIRIASITEPAPLGCPEGKTYLPTSLRTTLLGSLYASLSSGHLGSQCTLSLLQAWYWWPSMARDVSQYVCGCSVCAISKTPHHLPLEN